MSSSQQSAGSSMELGAAKGTAAPPPQVSVAWDGMSAHLTLAAAPDGYTEEETRAAIAKAGVVEGIDWDMVQSLVRRRTACQAVLIAKGTPPVHGTPGWVEYLFETGQRLPEEHAGRVDWRELRTIRSVAQGQGIARRHPAQAGTPGKNVRGKMLPCKPAKEAQLKLGNGAAVAPFDPELIIAATSGAIHLDDGGKLSVENVQTISGDVDFSVGNVEHVGNLVIAGGVKPGFTVKASGDVEVRGLIEEASIIAGGNVVASGIIGTPETSVRAGGDIRARFATNAMLTATGDLFLAQEAVNCDIEAEGRVLVGGERATAGAIMGGTVRAGREIVAFRVGGTGGAKTTLRTGLDWVIPRKVERVETEVNDFKAQLDKVEYGIDQLMSSDGDAFKNKSELLQKLGETRVSLVDTITATSERRRLLIDGSRVNSSIFIRGLAHAGTELIVDGKARILLSDLESQQFLVEDGVVVNLPIGRV
ncbi:MAG: DUF342 domain-containing protein [Chloroflexota bacterium]|nr:DUF342 domain-containing protein [Chloroflexota bacterium]